MDAHLTPALAVVEDSLLDVCELLGAQRFELDGSRVVFARRDASGGTTYWRGYLGDQVISCENGWRLSCDLAAETTWAAVA